MTTVEGLFQNNFDQLAEGRHVMTMNPSLARIHHTNLFIQVCSSIQGHERVLDATLELHSKGPDNLFPD